MTFARRRSSLRNCPGRTPRSRGGTMNAVFNHLWQTTLFAAAVGLVTLALRQNSARTRYWLWLAASVKFLVPFSVLVSAGGLLEWRTAPPVASAVSIAVEHVGQPRSEEHT